MYDTSQARSSSITIKTSPTFRKRFILHTFDVAVFADDRETAWRQHSRGRYRGTRPTTTTLPRPLSITSYLTSISAMSFLRYNHYLLSVVFLTVIFTFRRPVLNYIISPYGRHSNDRFPTDGPVSYSFSNPPLV